MARRRSAGQPWSGGDGGLGSWYRPHGPSRTACPAGGAEARSASTRTATTPRPTGTGCGGGADQCRGGPSPAAGIAWAPPTAGPPAVPPAAPPVPLGLNPARWRRCGGPGGAARAVGDPPSPAAPGTPGAHGAGRTGVPGPRPGPATTNHQAEQHPRPGRGRPVGPASAVPQAAQAAALGAAKPREVTALAWPQALGGGATTTARVSRDQPRTTRGRGRGHGAGREQQRRPRSWPHYGRLLSGPHGVVLTVLSGSPSRRSAMIAHRGRRRACHPHRRRETCGISEGHGMPVPPGRDRRRTPPQSTTTE